MDILDAVADTYRRQGPLRQHVAVRSFLADADADAVQEQLATCLDAGVLVVSGQGTVRLCDRLRVAVLTRPVLAAWVQQARTAAQPLSGALTEGIREELRALVRFCLTGQDDTQHRRAVELTAVLATSTLDVQAIDVVSGLPGTVRSQLQDLAAIPESSCRTTHELLARMRRYVTTEFVEAQTPG
jgi:hypothetical protein